MRSFLSHDVYNIIKNEDLGGSRLFYTHAELPPCPHGGVTFSRGVDELMVFLTFCLLGWGGTVVLPDGFTGLLYPSLLSIVPR